MPNFTHACRQISHMEKYGNMVENSEIKQEHILQTFQEYTPVSVCVCVWRGAADGWQANSYSQCAGGWGSALTSAGELLYNPWKWKIWVVNCNSHSNLHPSTHNCVHVAERKALEKQVFKRNQRWTEVLCELFSPRLCLVRRNQNSYQLRGVKVELLFCCIEM